MTAAPAGLRRDAERNRQRLLDAARVVFAERGLDAPLKDVARKADVSTATAYRHFADRASLVDALFEDALARMLQLAEEAIEAADPWQGLVDFVLGSLEIQAADRGVRDVVTASRHGSERIAAGRQRLFPAAERVIAAAQEAGVLRADVSMTDIGVLSTMLAFEMDYAGAVAPELWRRHAAVILDGLRARPGNSPLEQPALGAGQLAAVQDAWGAPAPS